MSQNQKHWNSTALVLLGRWLWEQGEYGHGLLCMHAPFWGLKIGTQLKVSWDDVMDTQDGLCRGEVIIADKDIESRPLSLYLIDSILEAYAKLPVNYIDDTMYMNYKTGKPLTSSTLNRELQRLSEKFLEYIKAETGLELNYKPLKTNAFEIAWALDMVAKYHYSKQVFSAVSDHMGHRTIKDTIQLLEVEPNETIIFDYDNVRGIHNVMNSEIFKSKEELTLFVYSKLVQETKDSDFTTISLK